MLVFMAKRAHKFGREHETYRNINSKSFVWKHKNEYTVEQQMAFGIWVYEYSELTKSDGLVHAFATGSFRNS